MRPDPLAFLEAELNELRAQGLYRPLRVLDGEQKAHASIDHRSVVNLSSNNYLGLTTHPRLRERALDALQTLGVGTGSVRTIAGTMVVHVELERRLAAFKKTEAAVVFQSGFTANAGTVSSLLGRDDVIVSDELNHASIIDGARLSRATIKVFPHRDVAAARAILAALPRTQRTLLITDGVFSMLRRLLGDTVFFNGLKRFYSDRRYQKAGTEDLERAFESESGRTLDRFFERWIFGTQIPKIRYSSTIGPNAVKVRFEQLGDVVFDLPVTVTLNYASGRTADIVVPITDMLVERSLPTTEVVRQVQVNRDSAAIAEFEEK